METAETAIQKLLENVGTAPGQGGLLEQFDKRLRKLQRRAIFGLIESISKEEADHVPVMLYKTILMQGKHPSLFRFSIPTWRGYDEVFWQALGDYAILALHRVKDLEYNITRGKITIKYFVRTTRKGRIRSPEEIRGIIQKIAFLIDNETLPTDFTRFRSMSEKREHIGDLSKEEAAAVGALLKLLPV